MAGNKLYIYDVSSEIDRKQAASRFTGQSHVTTLPCKSVAEVHTGLANLVAQGKSFRRVLFQTHGGPGRIWFDNDKIDAALLRKDFKGKYNSLFPTRTKMYFDGCNVADSSDGWDFLTAVGECLLPSGGGISMGYTSLGFGMGSTFSGHTIHAWGELRIIDFKIGGIEIDRFPNGSPGILKAAEWFQKLEAF